MASFPSARPLLQNAFVRGAVSGIGVMTLLAGVTELAALFAARHPVAADERG